MLDQLLTDVRYALRMWRRSPGFVLVAIATLALGIGANSTIFSVVNATLLRPLAFPDADRLMTVWKAPIRDLTDTNIVSMPNYKEWRSRSTSFASLAIFDSAGRGYNLTGIAEPEQVSGVRVTASFFDVLGVSPLLGRTFRPEEEEPGSDRVVVLSHGLWIRNYGGDRTIIGRPIQIDGLPYTVIGVMPASFRFQFWSGVRELWVPAAWTRGDYDQGSNSFICIGRLKPAVTLAQARSEMDAIGRSMSKERQYANDVALTAVLEPMSEYGLSELRPVMLALLGVVGFVLLIACANVANLMLARAATRHREFAIRCAVGAGRGRLVRQLLIESVLLGCMGGAAGLVIALWTTSLLVPVLPGNLTFIPLRPLDAIELDGRVLAFTTTISILSGVLFGLAPAATAFRDDLANPLKENARGSVPGARSRLRYGLVASEVALTLVTLAGAGVLMVSVSRLLGVDPGLDPKNVLVMEMSLPQEDLYYGPPDHAGFCQALDTGVRSIPGVVSVSGIGHLPMGGGGAGRSVGIEGQPDPGPERRPGAGYTVACPNILRTLGIKLLAGREFTQQDAVGAPEAALINQAMARQFWPKGDAVGKRFKIGGVNTDNPWLTVVGVYDNVRQRGLDSDAQRWFIRPYSQAGWPWMSIVAKTAAAPASFAGPVKKAIALIEPNQPVSAIRTMDQVVGDSVSSRRFPMLLLSGFATLALILAAVGIAGVVAYSVVQRTQEIGVRMALGAETRHVLQLVVGHSFRWTLAGVLGGVVASFGLLRSLQGLVYGVTPTDPLVLGAVSLLLVIVALGASYIPARRAARVDPVTALRCE
jgi:putative ABC transport system permease protein